MSEEKTFSQTELNSIISERLNKEKEKYESQISELTAKSDAYEKQIATFTSQLDDLNKKIATHESELKERDSKIQKYETQSVKMRVANELGLPYKMADRLSGETEEEIKADAESLKALMNISSVMPHKSPEEQKPESELDAAYRFLAKRE